MINGNETKKVYQKTFINTNCAIMDEEANKFREKDDIRSISTQTGIGCHDEGCVFFTTIFYTLK